MSRLSKPSRLTTHPSTRRPTQLPAPSSGGQSVPRCAAAMRRCSALRATTRYAIHARANGQANRMLSGDSLSLSQWEADGEKCASAKK